MIDCSRETEFFFFWYIYPVLCLACELFSGGEKMASLSGLAIGLSFLFGCILLGLVAELYYLLWWKKRFTRREKFEEEDYTHNTPVFSYLSCWEKPNSVNKVKTQEELQTPSLGIQSDVNGHEQDPELGMGKDLLLKGFGEESVEAELMRLHNLCGPPRLLFTINEETKEDLESEDGKSRGDRSRKGSRTRSLSDLLVTLDTPFLTPLPSPPLKAQQALDSYYHHGFNPLFESSTEAEINKLRSSPPPTFKFLRDAEEKLLRRLMEEAEKRALKKEGPLQDSIKKSPPNSTTNTAPDQLKGDGSFIKLIVGKSKEGEAVHHQLSHYHSTPSQVLPLASSPSAIRPFDQKSSVH